MEKLQNQHEYLAIDHYRQILIDLCNRMNPLVYQEWVRDCDREIALIIPDRRERQECKLWHLLVGGSFDDDNPKFDFDGDISIRKMIEDKKKEIKDIVNAESKN
jgi:hypothetical protein